MDLMFGLGVAGGTILLIAGAGAVTSFLKGKKKSKSKGRADG